EGLGEPAPAQLLHRGDVDGPVVEVVVDVGKVGGEEAPVHPDGVAGQRNGARVGGVSLDEVEGGASRLFERDRRGLDGVEQPALGVHVANHVVHTCEDVRRVVHDQVGALGDQLEVVPRDEGGDL